MHNPIEVCQLCHSPSINRLAGPFGSGSNDEAVEVSSSFRLERGEGDRSPASAFGPGGRHSDFSACGLSGRMWFNAGGASDSLRRVSFRNLAARYGRLGANLVQPRVPRVPVAMALLWTSECVRSKPLSAVFLPSDFPE